jgi:aminoglycoside phosphotransferase (APT) family kinase protein
MAQGEQLEESTLQEYLRDRLGDGALEVKRLKRNVGGMSRETWFVDTETSEGNRTFTWRVDHPEGSVVPVPLELEYKVYRALEGSAVPIARALWYERDHALLGRPFYVRDTIEGSSAPKLLFAEGQEELRRTIGRQFARLLARVHTLDWEQAGFPEFMPVPQSGPECALLELQRWYDHYQRMRVEPQPVHAELHSWLRRNAPTDVPRISLVWGDVGLGNFIFQDDRIVGLTDWEQAHIGDPMKDWASALWRGVDHLLPRDELFEIYEQESSIPIDEERIRYYTVFIDVQYVCTSHPVLRRLAEGQDMDITFTRLGLGIPYHCLHDGLETIGY